LRGVSASARSRGGTEGATLTTVAMRGTLRVASVPIQYYEGMYKHTEDTQPTMHTDTDISDLAVAPLWLDIQTGL
jgi:hypothetical protein